MKIFILISFIILSSSAKAQKAKVLIVDPDFESRSLQEDYEIQRPAQPYALPDKGDRDELLKDIKSAEAWDELKKDIFFMDAKSKSPAELKTKYSELSSEDLMTIKKRMK